MKTHESTCKPSRPCSEYNIFFQLERAYILQVMLGAEPSLEGLQPFHPSQPSYRGLPPLPSRYASLILPYDWHLPGKEARRKRKHRKTHGAIGFHDLSDRIAAAWRVVDEGIKVYCARVRAAGMVRYRAAMEEWRLNGGLFQQEVKGAVPAMTAEPSRKKKVTKKEGAAGSQPLTQREPARKINCDRARRKQDETASKDIFALRSQSQKSRLNDSSRDKKAPPAGFAKEEDRDAASHSHGNLMEVGETEARAVWMQDERLIEQFFAAGADVALSPVENPNAAAFRDSDGLDQDNSQRNASIVSNEPVDIGDDEIMGMWNDRSDAAANRQRPSQEQASAPSRSSIVHRPSDTGNGGEAAASSAHGHRQDIVSVPSAAPFLSSRNDAGEDVDKRGLLLGLVGYDQTMEEMRRLKSMLEMQVKALEGAYQPPMQRRAFMPRSA